MGDGDGRSGWLCFNGGYYVGAGAHASLVDRMSYYIAPEKRELSEKRKREARKRRREFLERWSLKLRQLENLTHESAGTVKFRG